MYEPYGEKKKLNFDFKRIKEKVKEKLGDLNLGNMNKMAFVVVALLLLVTLGGITGYVTYTGKVEEMETQFMVMEKQIQGLNDELTATNEELTFCSNNLENTAATLDFTKEELTATVLNLEQTKNNLDTCNNEKTDLNLVISQLEDDLVDANMDLDELNEDYSDLETDFENLACRVAKMSSCDYYVIEGGDRVVCCFRYEGDFICSGDIVDDGVLEVDC